MTTRRAPTRNRGMLTASLLTALSLGIAPAAAAQDQATLDKIFKKVKKIEAKLDAALASSVSLQVCVDGEFALGGQWEIRGDAEIPVDASIGADAYGNGLTLKATVKGKTGLQVGADGQIGASIHLCFDLLPTAAAIAAGTYEGPLSPVQQQRILAISQIDVDTIHTKLLNAVASTKLDDPATLEGALDLIPTLTTTPDPLAIFGQSQVLQIAGVVPVPPAVRDSLMAADQLVDGVTGLVTDLRQICGLALPPAVLAVIAEVCGKVDLLGPAIQGLVTAVNSVKGTVEVGIKPVVTSINTTVNTIKGFVDSIPADVVNFLCDNTFVC